MNKKIAIITIFTTFLSFAGPKADLEKALNLLDNGKVVEAFTILKNSKNVEGEEEEFERINYMLGTRADITPEQKEMYLKKASSDPKSKGQYAVLANELLAKEAKNPKEKLVYLNLLRDRLGDDLDIFADLAFNYYKERDIENYSKIIKEAESKKAEFRDQFYYVLGKKFLEQNEENQGISMLNKAAVSDFNNIKAQVCLVFAKFYLLHKDVETAKMYLITSEAFTPNDADLISTIARIYSEDIKDTKKAIKEYEKALNLEKDNIEYIKALLLESIAAKDVERINKYSEILKKAQGNYGVAQFLYMEHKYDEAIKYANKSLEEGTKEADVLLTVIYMANHKLDLAEQHAKEALKNNLLIAKELLKEIEKMK